ncbi:MAG: sulfatase-like hydrolase/transferase [Vicinamibacteria bacterium]|nr:sulfatase-like hydrolase/transferase [Vicinamibacteria bacterium]
MASRRDPKPAAALARNASRRSVLILVGLIALFAVAFLLSRPRSVPRDPGLSVLLISIDTLRADAIGVYGNKNVQTPWIDRLAKAGVRFEKAHAHNVVTLPSHVNILSGQYPITHTVRDNTGFRVPADLETLATRLKARGFATGAFVSAFVLDSRFGLDRGFDVYDDHTAGIERQSPFMVPDRKGVETVARAVQWIEAHQDVQFFAFVHLYDPHFPYEPPEPFASRHRDAPYFGEVEAADAALEPLLKSILDGPWGNKTLVILTADHGESLEDHGESTHGTFAYEATLHVPLILKLPGVSGRTVETPVRHIDIVPTVLDALGMDAAKGFPGDSLWPLALGGRPKEGFSSYFEALSASLNQGWAPLRGIFDGRYKYIDLPLPELYDVTSDPGEKTNLVAREPETLDRLRISLARVRTMDLGVKRAAEDVATLERLRALGYIAAASQAEQKDVYSAEDDPKNLIGINVRAREVVTAFMRGSIDEAIALANENLRQRPGMAGVSLQLAFLLRARGNLGEAIVAARRAVELKPLDPEGLSLLAAYLTEAGRAQEAVDLLEPYAKAAALDYDVVTALGLARAAVGKTALAREAFEIARQLDPGNPMSLVNLGTLALMTGDRMNARDALTSALSLDPSIAKAHNTLGVMAAQEGRFDEAIASWRKAAELNPRDYQTLFNLGKTLDRLGRAAEAELYYRQYLQAAPLALESRDIERVKARLRAKR